MQSQQRRPPKRATSLSFYLKCVAIFLLFLLSILVVACSGGTADTNGTPTDLGAPAVTVTIHIGATVSPTPALAPYSCGAWATQTSPSYNTTSNVGVYAKFTHNVDGNPEGVDDATATATVMWPDGTTLVVSTLTTFDGLAVFSIPTANKLSAVNKMTLVTVAFVKTGVPSCTVDTNRAAFFTLIVITPTPAPTKAASPTTTPGGVPTVLPTP